MRQSALILTDLTVWKFLRLKKVEEMERLWEALKVNGFTESQIDRIAYGNAKRVLQAL